MAEKVEQQLKEVGSKLESLPSSKDALIKLLKQAAVCLSELEQSPPAPVLEALQPFLNAIVKPILLKHQDKDVKLLVATCICEITRITAPEAPYGDDVMKDIFQLIVGTFSGLKDISGPSFGRRVIILETVAKYRSCVVMLDLECDDLVNEMFSTFFTVASSSFPVRIWKIKVPKKVLLVCWLGVLGKLNTMDMLQKRMPNVVWNPHWCILCKASGESINHCFLHCALANKVWNKFRGVSGFIGPLPQTISELFHERWVCFGSSKRGCVLKDIIMTAIIWVLWEERNHRIFEDKYTGWEELWDRIQYLSSLWASISKEFSDFSFNSIRYNWEAVVCR